MNSKLVLDILTALGAVGAACGTVGAVMVALRANYISKKNSWQQIRVSKLEELYEAIQSISSYYPIFELLQYQIAAMREKQKKDFDWLTEYSEKRDAVLPEADRKLIIYFLARIEILTNCYTSGDLQISILDIQNLLSWFSDLVFDGSSMNDILANKQTFPEHQDFIKVIEKLKKGILSEIKDN